MKRKRTITRTRRKTTQAPAMGTKICQGLILGEMQRCQAMPSLSACSKSDQGGITSQPAEHEHRARMRYILLLVRSSLARSHALAFLFSVCMRACSHNSKRVRASVRRAHGAGYRHLRVVVTASKISTQDKQRLMVTRPRVCQEGNWRQGRKDFPMALRAGVAAPLYGRWDQGVGKGGQKRKRKGKVYSPFPGGPEYVFGADHRLKGRTWGMGKCAPNDDMCLGSNVTRRSCLSSYRALLLLPFPPPLLPSSSPTPPTASIPPSLLPSFPTHHSPSFPCISRRSFLDHLHFQKFSLALLRYNRS